MIGHNAVDFFRHRSIEAAQPGLDMGHGNLKFGGGKSTRQRRVGVSVHDDDLRPFLLENGLDPLKHSPCLCAMRATAYPKVIVWWWNVQVIKMDVRHSVIVVLPGMEQDLLMMKA